MTPGNQITETVIYARGYSPQAAYAAGFDAEMNGPDGHNCDPRFFQSEQHAAEWELGRAEAQAYKCTVRAGRGLLRKIRDQPNVLDEIAKRARST
jgi:hypothetical protein